MKKKNLMTMTAIMLISVTMSAGCGAQSEDVTVLMKNEAKQTESINTDEAQNVTEIETKEVTTTQEAVSETEASNETEVEARELSDEDFAVIINDITVAIGADINTLTDFLDEPQDYSAAKSCTGAGEDKVYQYGNTYIYTNPTGTEDVIYLIEIEEGNEITAGGIGVGASKEDVLSVYGSGYEEDGANIVYNSASGMTMSFQTDGDTVSFIEIYGN